MPERIPKPWKITAVILLLGGLVAAIASLLLGANELLKNGGTLLTTASSVFATDSVTVTRTSSSDQINVGCEERGSTTTSVTLPDRAHEVQAVCRWTATDKLKANDCRVDTAARPVVASGWINGEDRDWFKNCHGGGHGTLTLSVAFKQHPAPSLPVLLVIVAIVLFVGGAIVLLGWWMQTRRRGSVRR